MSGFPCSLFTLRLFSVAKLKRAESGEKRESKYKINTPFRNFTNRQLFHKFHEKYLQSFTFFNENTI